MPENHKPGRLPVTLVVPTRDEQRNLGACLRSVAPWVSRTVVVDSGSTDRTQEIATAHGAEVVTHPFEGHARQWRWAFEHLDIQTDWVLALDADQRATPALIAEMQAVLGAPGADSLAGCFVVRRQVFRGRWIRHGGYYPKYLLKLFRRNAVWIDEGELVDHHFRVRGATRKLAGEIVEENLNENAIATWVAKHNRYAVLQAREEFEQTNRASLRHARAFGSPDERVLWRKRLWGRAPLLLRPCLYFLYRYVIRLGFLDGRQGFVFHVLQAFWYRLLVDINLEELRNAARPGQSGPNARGDARETT